jgi:hypothetical protein
MAEAFVRRRPRTPEKQSAIERPQVKKKSFHTWHHIGSIAKLNHDVL